MFVFFVDLCKDSQNKMEDEKSDLSSSQSTVKDQLQLNDYRFTSSKTRCFFSVYCRICRHIGTAQDHGQRMRLARCLSQLGSKVIAG